MRLTIRQTDFEARSLVAKQSLWFRETLARYDAAQPHSTRRSHISIAPQEPRFTVNQSSRTAVAEKAKHFEENNAVAQRIGSVFVDYTVGPNGLVLIPNSTDAEWNKPAKDYWNQTGTFIDLKSRQPFGMLQGLIAWRWLFDGEIFLLKTRGQDAAGRWRPRIQLIEYYLVQTPPDRLRDEGKTIVDGVELDANGRPSGYWVKDGSQSTSFRFIEARDIIHVFEPARPGQYRGMSFFHAAINYLHRLDDLQELEFRAVTDAAEKSTFVKTATGQIPPSLFGGIPPSGLSSSAQATVSMEQRETDLRETIGGRTAALMLGEDVTQFTPQRPTDSTRALWSYLTSCVCAAIGIPKMICFSEWLDKMQGTIVRGDYDIAAQFFRARSAVLASAFREVYLYVIGWGIATEASLADRPGDGSWVNVTVRPPKAVNVDVGRNSSAMLAELSAGATNYELIYSPLGLDWQEELTKLADQVQFINRLAADRGISPTELREQAAKAVSTPEPVPVRTTEEDEE